MKRVHEDWYQGTADAVFQNFQSIGARGSRRHPDLSGDHIYKMNYTRCWTGTAEQCRRHHCHAPGAARRVRALRDSRDRRRFPHRGVRGEASTRPGRALRARPVHGQRIHGHLRVQTGALLRALHADAQNPNSSHDFAKDVIPNELSRLRVVAYDFRDMNAKQVRYWRDVGTLDAYYDANMDLVSVTPEFNLYDQRWPIRTKVTQQPPAKFVFAQEGRRMGVAVDSVVSAGLDHIRGRVLHSVLSPGVRVNSYCEVEYSILMPGVEIGRYSRIRRAIINTGVKLPIPVCLVSIWKADRAKGHHVTDNAS